MAVLVTILKFVGWLLLFLLALLALVLICALFVPFRYRLDGSYLEETPDGTVELSWLWHAVSVRVTWHHGAAVSGSIRLFGVCVRRIEAVPE